MKIKGIAKVESGMTKHDRRGSTNDRRGDGGGGGGGGGGSLINLGIVIGIRL